MISGARKARPSALRRLFARAAARELRAFVVPGAEAARAAGMDLEAAGLPLADTPRHASVLVLIGDPPPALERAAAVAYAQMPRPRAILAVGAVDASPLPAPDVSVARDQGALAEGVAGLRRAFAAGAFAPEAAPFDAAEIRTETRYVCPMHPDVTSDEPGSCPKCGMDLMPREETGGEAGHGGHSESQHQDPGAEHAGEHGAVDHREAGHDRGDHDGGSGEHEGMNHGAHGGAGHGGHDHGGHDHGDMEFMSMVEMTKDLPRSSDGLPMEWVEAPFGPLFPGLPGGLSLRLTLDGDTVAGAEAEAPVGVRSSRERLAGPVRGLAGRLAGIGALSPAAYRALALRAVEDATGVAPGERTALARVGVLERERAASHLSWLAGFARLLGLNRLERRAARLQLAVQDASSPEELPGLRREAGELAREVRRTPLLRRRLRGIGALPAGAEALGPVARATGAAVDARAGEEAYRALGFEPVVGGGGDALARLLVRLAEMEQSLRLAEEAGAVVSPEGPAHATPSGTGTATVETPRGAARLSVAIEGGTVIGGDLETPSTRHLCLAGAAAEGREVADALVGVASLDLSPWEVLR